LHVPPQDRTVLLGLTAPDTTRGRGKGPLRNRSLRKARFTTSADDTAREGGVDRLPFIHAATCAYRYYYSQYSISCNCLTKHTLGKSESDLHKADFDSRSKSVEKFGVPPLSSSSKARQKKGSSDQPIPGTTHSTPLRVLRHY
jgi:hypothetical protein